MVLAVGCWLLLLLLLLDGRATPLRHRPSLPLERPEWLDFLVARLLPRGEGLRGVPPRRPSGV